MLLEFDNKETERIEFRSISWIEIDTWIIIWYCYFMNFIFNYFEFLFFNLFIFYFFIFLFYLFIF